jgi:hypothetical protein
MASKGTCKAESCDKDVIGKGYCVRHYRLWRRGELPKARYKTCHTEGCRKKQSRAGRCEEHQKVKAKTTTSEPQAAAAT